MSATSTRRVLTHAELDERLVEELARATRAERATALGMARTRPGEGGRFVQAALARLRVGDLVATWAHDQVEILLPDTTREHAVLVLSRLSEEAGVAVGIAVAPLDGRSAPRLVRAARDDLAARSETGRPPGLKRELALEDPSSERTLHALTAALARGHVLVTGEASVGKVSFARRAHARLAATGGDPGTLVVVPCVRARDARELGAALSGDPARPVTIVLDEISDLAASALEALSHVPARMRIVATRSNEQPRMLAGRLASWVESLGPETVVVPPLRQRTGELLLAAKLFADEWSAGTATFSPGAITRICAHAWPGNMLELQNAIERAVALAGHGEILADHLPAEVSVQPDGGLRAQVDSVERDAIQKALAEASHNQTHAARALGLSRRALIYKMEKYGLKPPPGARQRRG
jgi:two-component system response regulator AtoC